MEEPSRARRDRGFSLIEVVVTITLMAVVIVPIMTAVITSITASSQGRAAAQVETALVNAADRINRVETLECDYLIYAQNAVLSLHWDADRAAVRYAHYVPGDSIGLGGWSNDGNACLIDGVTQGLVQRVIITITSPDGNIRREIQVVKSDV